MPENELNLAKLKDMMRAAGATQLYLKRLAENDNSKNQVYLGPDFSALNVLPTGELVGDPEKPERLKAPMQFSWLSAEGSLAMALGAQLILYPQYPEVRFSGFLKGCSAAPSSLMTVRQGGRLLFFGVTASGHVLGFVAAHDSSLAREAEELSLQPSVGVFAQIALEIHADDRSILISELSRIANLGWIRSKRLNSKGELLQCSAPNCGGYTLEAELGIRPNGISDPDFHGWEIKQHAVTNLERPSSGGPITLMTPEPTGGVYVDMGVREFIRRYGYPDRTVTDRMNFGGIHTAMKVCTATNLALTLDGYDSEKQKIVNFTKGISLLDQHGESAATWHYKDLWRERRYVALQRPFESLDAETREGCLYPLSQSEGS